MYGEYARFMGPAKVALLAACMLLGQALFLASQYWLAVWASRPRSVQRQAKCARICRADM